MVSNIGANSHNPNAKPVPFPKDSASINLLATDITNNMIHPKTGTSKTRNNHVLIPNYFNPPPPPPNTPPRAHKF